MKRQIPDESTLRKGYISACYEETVLKLREKFKGARIWLSVNETTDVEGRFLVGVVWGVSYKDKFERPYF